jgi:hypothetical protein
LLISLISLENYVELRSKGTFDHHIADIDADTIEHLTVGWQFGVSCFQLLLNFDRALDVVHSAGKLRQQIVAWQVHNPAPMPLDEVRHQLPIGRECTNRRLFIVTIRRL